MYTWKFLVNKRPQKDCEPVRTGTTSSDLGGCLTRGGDWRALWDLAKRRERHWLLAGSSVQMSIMGSRKEGESFLENHGDGPLGSEKVCV